MTVGDSDVTAGSLADIARSRSPKALVRRDEAFARRRDVLGRLSAGDIDFEVLLAIAAADKDVARTRIVRALAALPGWGPKKARFTIDAAGIDDRRTLGWLLGERAVKHLNEILTAIDPPPPPELPSHWPWWDNPEQAPTFKRV